MMLSQQHIFKKQGMVFGDKGIYTLMKELDHMHLMDMFKSLKYEEIYIQKG